MAAIVATPELQLGDAEGRQYAEAVVAYARHYDVAAQAKTVDLINLLMVSIGHYGMAIVAARLRRKAEAAEQINEAPPYSNGYGGAADLGQTAGEA